MGEVQRGGVAQFLSAEGAGTNEWRDNFTQDFKDLSPPSASVKEGAEIATDTVGTTRHRESKYDTSWALAHIPTSRARSASQMRTAPTSCRDRHREAGCSQQFVTDLVIQDANNDNVAGLDGGQYRRSNLPRPTKVVDLSAVGFQTVTV